MALFKQLLVVPENGTYYVFTRADGPKNVPLNKLSNFQWNHFKLGKKVQCHKSSDKVINLKAIVELPKQFLLNN